MNLFSLLEGRDGSQPFLTDLRSNRSYSYADLRRASLCLVRLLSRRSIVPGDKIVYLTVNSAFFFPLLLACAFRRVALVPLNPKMHSDELRYIIKQLSPGIIFYDEDWAQLAGSFESSDKVQVQSQDMLCLAKSEDTSQESEALVVEKGDGNAALIIYTSGTTTNSKGVALSHKNLDSMARIFSAFYGFQQGQRFLSMLPFYHINAPVITGLACISAGAHVFLSEVFGFSVAKSIWGIVEQHKIQVLSITPSIMASLNDVYPSGTVKDISSIEYGLVGTAHLKESLWKSFEARFHIPCFQGYGLTETTTWAVMTPRDERKRYDSAGIPVGCEVRIDPSSLMTLEGIPEGSGEVLIKGDIVMKGYWGNPEATKAVLVDGWLRTGDVGFIDKDGQLVITGRIKNIIKRKGQLVIPEDIDTVVGRYPHVAESCTFGIPDDMLGERVVTACVLKERTQAIESELYDFVRESVSQQNMPDQFVFFQSLPKNSLGKANLKKLKEYVTGKTTQDVFAIFDKARYRKAKTPDKEAILGIIQTALIDDSPFFLLGYWGVGKRDRVNGYDCDALDNLRMLLDEANRLVGRNLVKGKLILADIHGRCNLVPEASADAYFRAIAEECRKRDFEYIFLSEIWAQAGLVFDDVLKRLEEKSFNGLWQEFFLKEQFIKQAERRLPLENAELAARKYYAVVMAEREIVARYGMGTVFFTYNDLEYSAVNPPLPTIYIHSIKAGISEKPWFLGSSSGINPGPKGRQET
ncbi:MAG: class I adenylate-forming enzyme family protein [Candidatus Omnitrophica bacterium]|nr:class I adenylate-forming enzyme family protein [Candidatus Omnitrophota bacterium]